LSPEGVGKFTNPTCVINTREKLKFYPDNRPFIEVGLTEQFLSVVDPGAGRPDIHKVRMAR